MNEEGEKNDSLTPDVGGNGPGVGERVGQAGKKLADKGKDALKKKAKEKLGKDQVKKATLKAIPPIVIFWAVVVIVAIIVIIGIIMFFATLPGLVMGKLKAIFKEIGNFVSAFFGADTTEQFEKTEIYDTLTYLEEMGYDLKGYGFLTDYYDDENEDDLDKIVDSLEISVEEGQSKRSAITANGYKFDKKMGVIRDGSDDIALAESDFIFSYIVSDNYAYTIKNTNLVTQSNTFNGVFDEFVGGLLRLGTRIDEFLGLKKLRNLALRPLELFFNTDIPDATDIWGKGLIAIYDETGTYKDLNSMWNFDSIKIDIPSKKLIIKRTTLFNNNNAMEYSLDGWAGRYSMPVEFLMSVHVATMMPDLAYDISTSFPTNVNLYLHAATGDVVAAFKNDEGKYVTFSEINEALYVGDGRNIFSRIGSWFIKIFDNDQSQAAVADSLGILIHSDPCDCDFDYFPTIDGFEGTYGEGDDAITVYWSVENGCFVEYDENGEIVIDDDGNVVSYNYVDVAYDRPTDPENPGAFQRVLIKVNTTCSENYKYVVDLADNYDDSSFKYYIPYIHEVKNHWYRDVYFMLDTRSSINFVQTDEDYESLMKERWTLYEIYEDDDVGKYDNTDANDYVEEHLGEYKIYVLNTNGTYAKWRDSDTSFLDMILDGDYASTAADMLLNGGYSNKINNTNLIVKDPDTDNLLFIGSSDQAKDLGIAVAKKAVTLDVNFFSDQEVLGDYGWNEVSSTVWSAYEFDTTGTVTGYEPAYNASDIAEEEDPVRREVMERVYAKLTSSNNVTQTGEGMRAETNPTIKKMFLYNTYFRYDGNVRTAEVITALRKKISKDINNSDAMDLFTDQKSYGALNQLNLTNLGIIGLDYTKKEYSAAQLGLDDEDQEKMYKVSDYSGKVSLNQDSLNAFSMLENTNTLDSDYIYRDFKELIVELGYFTKEELTDETPRLMQWLVPEIGSANYPNRTIDKRENEYGTGVHSKLDIDANNMYIAEELMEIMSTVRGEVEDSNVGGRATGVSAITRNVTNNLQAVTRRNVTTLVGVNVSDVIDLNKAPSSSQVTGITATQFVDKAREIWTQMSEIGYNYCVLTRDNEGENGCTCNSACREGSQYGECLGDEVGCTCSGIHCNHDVHPEIGCGLSSTFEESLSSETYNACCATFVSWVLKAVGVDMSGCENMHGAPSVSEYLVEELGAKVITDYSKLKPGDVLSYVHAGESEIGHVDILGEEDGSEFIRYNAGHSIAIGSSPDGFDEGSFNGEELCFGIRLFNTRDPKEYTGYQGNEAVVSPVTGVLLEYGTYTGEEINSVNENPERLNVDIKYGPSTAPEDFEGKEVSDKVGYAKILVLDTENYQKLEESAYNINREYLFNNWGGQGLIAENGSFRNPLEDDNTSTAIEKIKSKNDRIRWTDFQQTIYGYKEFAEEYEKAGIAGYIVYIDGFVCEFPDEDIPVDDDTPEEMPRGEKITIDTFEKDELSYILSEDQIPSQYFAEDVYKLASQKAYNKLKAEEEVKATAASTLYVKDYLNKKTNENEDLIFIKQGTVIGRTMTDKELLEGDIRMYEDDTELERTFDENRKYSKGGDSEVLDNIIGNYIRIILRDLDGTVVENVEDYMLLDEKNTSKNDWEFWYWLPYESGAIDKPDGGPEYVNCRDENEGQSLTINETSDSYNMNVGIICWTTNKAFNEIAKFCRAASQINPSLCSTLSKYGNDTYDDLLVLSRRQELREDFRSICASDRDGFLEVQFDIAKYGETGKEPGDGYWSGVLNKYPWVEKKSSVIQGTFMSIQVKNGALPDGLSENSSDEDLVIALMKFMYDGEPIDGIEQRCYGQGNAAIDIINGNVTEEEVEGWVRNTVNPNTGKSWDYHDHTDSDYINTSDIK